MILVLLGTQKHQFPRIIEYVLQLCQEEKLAEEIIIQCGNTDYHLVASKFSAKISLIEYLPDYESLIKRANLVVCHAGVGIIMDCLKHQKKIITIPRQQKLGEHLNDHQQELAQELSVHNYLMMATTYLNFKKKYCAILTHEFKPYVSNNYLFNYQLNQLIEQMLGD